MAATAGGMNRFYLILGGLAAAGVAVLVALTLRSKPVSIPANATVAVSDTSGFHGYYLGSDSAPITVTEYADYECPACQEWYTVQFPTIEERLIKTGKVRWRYRDFPLDQLHPNALTSAHAAACADEQGKFWEMSHRIYSWEPRWPEQRDALGTFSGYAKAVGLDLPKYGACMESARYAGRLQASKAEGMAAGVGSTPTFLINGQLYAGGKAVHYDMLKQMLDSLAGGPAR
jgi:protein-disulfide isomerase